MRIHFNSVYSTGEKKSSTLELNCCSNIMESRFSQSCCCYGKTVRFDMPEVVILDRLTNCQTK